MFKRLKEPSGSVANQADQADASDKITRPAILVHSGPNGENIVFQSSDGEIAFDEARIKRIVENQNKLLNGLAEQYGGFDKVPPGAFPPLLDQHENDSNNRIVGRMMALLKFEKRDVPKVGKNVACAVTEITFLGAENVQRVNDGRIFHLSIGIDETTDTLGETSTVIEPAAPGAMLLNRKAASPVVRLKKEQNMGKNLARIQAHANRMAKLTAIKEGLGTLSAGVKGASETVKLTKKTGEVSHRLTGLMRAGKLTPAEFKKIDVKRLAKLDSESLNTVLDTYEVREPQVAAGQKGTTDAVPFTELAAGMKKKNLKRLKAEIANDFKKLSGGKLNLASLEDEDEDHGKDHEMAGGNKEHEINPGKDPHDVPGEGGDMKMGEFKEHMAHCAKCLAEGDVDGAKEHHEKAMKHMAEHFGEGKKDMSAGVGDVKSEDYKAGMDALESKVDEMGTQLARFAGMVSELMDAEKEEGHDLEKSDDEHDGGQA